MENQQLKVSYKKKFFKISENSQENTWHQSLFLIKLLASARKFIKREALAQVFYCEFCKTFKNTSFYRTPPGDWFCGC